MNDKKFIEKYLKSSIKSRKIGYTTALLVSFLINGNIAYSEELNFNEIKLKIAENNKRIEEIERRTVELLKEGDYYAKILEDNRQFFFPLNIEHRHSNKSAKGNSIPLVEIEPSKPIIRPTPLEPAKPIIRPTPLEPAKPIKPAKPEVPESIDIDKPLLPEIPEKSPTLPSDDVIKIEDIKQIVVETPTINIAPNKPTVHFDREYIEDIQLGIDGKGVQVQDIKVDENVSEAVNIPNYEVNVNSPVKRYDYDPTIAKNPEIFEIGDVRHPEEIDLPDIKVNTNSFAQGSGGIIGHNPKGNAYTGPVNQAVVENYSQYIADEGKTVKISFKDGVGEDNESHNYVNIENKQDITLSTNITENYLVDKKIYEDKFRKEYYRNPPNKEGKKRGWIGQTAAFISNTMAKDSVIKGKWELNYAETDYKEKVTRIFISVNPAGLDKNLYNKYGTTNGRPNNNMNQGKSEGVTTDFTGEVTLTNKTENGTLVAMDHQLWDTFNPGGSTDKDDYATKIDQLKYYSIAKNSGTINLGNEDGGDKNLIGITINQERETSALLKLNNHVTLNDGLINVNGSNSLGISYEFGGGIQKKAEGNTNARMGVILDNDLYAGNINLNSTSEKSYGIRLQNVYYNPQNKEEKHIKDTEFTNKHFYDNTRIFGSLEDNQGKEKKNIEGLSSKDTTIKKIKVEGSNNAGFVVGKSLSSGAERYLKNTPENKKKNEENIGDITALDKIKHEGNLDIYTSYIGKFNSDLGEKFEGFDFGEVNPIANIHGLNIEVNGDKNVGFLRHKDYSDNNTNDMIITKESTGAIKNIDFGENAKNSILIRSDMYGIEVQKDLTIGKNGINETDKKVAADTTDKNDTIETPQELPEKNIILQATKSTWAKVLPKKDNQDGTEERDVLSVGHIINSGTIKSTEDNMIGMMANTSNLDKFNEKAEALNKYTEKDARIINRNTIELTGKNVIGMAVLDGNKGILENGKVTTQMNENATSSVEKDRDYNVSIYNDGNFEIKNSIVETSGKGSVAVYNNNGTVTINKENTTKIDDTTLPKIDEEMSQNLTQIVATKGATALYSKGGDITVSGMTTISTDTGIGVYAVSSDKENATINLDGTIIDVGKKGAYNGDAGLVASGKSVIENNTKDIKINRGGVTPPL
ncbi:hypothetical protein [Paraclostridium bifermentans]|uniref:hypothetical protein n=1 Tax=Paraclostridium bifermentans TaxID=1490 RepID=UPI002430E9E0|nr:hypothetical protein [Paraclostridium bifermentans]